MRTTPTLLLIHGFPHDATLWSDQLAPLGTMARVLAPDLRGFGKSDRPIEEATMEDHVADILQLLDKAHIDRVVLCGLSMGGYVALAFVADHPDRVAGLILSNTRAEADDDAARAKRVALAQDVMENGMAGIARDLVPKMLSECTRTDRPKLTQRVESMMARQAPGAVAAAAMAIAHRADHTMLLPNIQVPSLIITGSADELMPFEASRTMHEAIPGSELVVINGTAHLPNVEDPVAFNSAVGAFMKRLVE